MKHFDSKAVVVRGEGPADLAAIRALHRAAFGGDAEAQLVDELRAEGHAAISLVAELERAVVAHVLFSPVEIAGRRNFQVLALAPVGVLPEMQRQGLGSILIRAGLEQAAAWGASAVLVLGEPDYYRRFGFRPELTQSLQSPYAGAYFMALELVPGAREQLVGVARHAPPFGGLE